MNMTKERAKTKASLSRRILINNLQVTELYLRNLNEGTHAYNIRQALDIICPKWRDSKV